MAKRDVRKGPAPKLRDVAARAGVSIGTASNAFSRPGALAPDTRERVLAAARELGYGGPDPVARRLRTGRAGAIGLLFTADLTFAFEDQASTLFLRGVAKGLESADTGLLIVPTAPDLGRAAEAVRTAAVDGFIVYSSAEDDPRIAAALARRLPLVVVDEPRDPPVPWIGIDDRAAARSAAELVRDLGHERVAILRFGGRADGHLFAVTVDRLQGFVDGLGSKYDPALVFECLPNSTERARLVAAEAIAARPTAILTMSDAMAVGVLQAAKDAGVDVPKRLSVVGFDGTPATLATSPALTTVAQPQEEKGRLAAKLVIGGARRRMRHTLETELLVRWSTAPPPRRA